MHDAEELEAALEIDADVIGINNRDLSDFSVDLARTFELLADVPAGKTVVSESGISSREQVEELERVGVDAVLVGESLMRSADPEQACRELTARRGDDAGLRAQASSSAGRAMTFQDSLEAFLILALTQVGRYN